ncbi:transposase [Polyangium sp. 15x6]|nr:transposase [Polyangium sp. 15x6]
MVVGYDRELCAAVVGAFVEELLRSYRWRAKRMFGLSSVEDAFPGAVTVIQRFDSALRLNVHAHTLVLDGVYVRRAGMDGECLPFLRLSAPTEGEVQNVAERTAKRVAAILKNRGRSIEGLSGGEVGDDIEPALMACYGVAARAPALRVVEPSRIREDERVAVVMGLNVHAGAAIDGRDRKRVERVCRYLVRCRRRVFIGCGFTACSRRMRHCEEKSFRRHGHRQRRTSRHPSAFAVASIR